MPVIDVHAHWGVFPFATRMASVADINGILERFDIEKCLLSSAEAIVHDFVKGNQLLAEAIAGQPRLLGYVTINPNYIEASLEELKKYLYKENFVGVKFHTEYTGVAINAPETNECFNACRRYDKPILIHCFGSQQVEQLLAVVEEFQSLNFIMGHMGGNAWKDGVEQAAEHFNLFLEPCATLADRDKIHYAIDKMGDRRVLFGSDLTLINPAFVAGMVRDANISVQQKERMFYKNAKELFKL
ncbi:MAG: amidohydrolase family protein [Armatimonadetes bacterium]|nr:amidohydrolase family protein [Armatimonadota bacterium]